MGRKQMGTGTGAMCLAEQSQTKPAYSKGAVRWFQVRRMIGNARCVEKSKSGGFCRAKGKDV